MTIITVDALDAVELAKIFEFVFGSLDTLVGPATVVPSCDGDAYHLADLRGDIARLAHRLTSSLTPDATPTPITVEVDRGSASSWGRPLERAWLIRLRRADQSVVVAIGLSRTGAEHLAAHITDVIAPTARNAAVSRRRLPVPSPSRGHATFAALTNADGMWR
jgi:hypothetical protein